MNTIGYKELFDYMNGDCNIEKSVEQIMEYEEANHSCTTLSEEEEIFETGVSVIQLIVKLEKQMLGAAKNLVHAVCIN